MNDKLWNCYKEFKLKKGKLMRNSYRLSIKTVWALELSKQNENWKKMLNFPKREGLNIFT